MYEDHGDNEVTRELSLIILLIARNYIVLFVNAVNRADSIKE
jgi:hypothetical protein